MNREEVDLSVTIGKIKLKNPVMPASGTFGYGQEYADFLDINDLGALVTKCITPLPRLGSYQHRFLEVAGCASMNTGGLQNVGVERFIKDKLPYLRQFQTPVIVNIGGEKVEDFGRVAEILGKEAGISALEINISCPNVKKGGMNFGTDPEMTFQVVKAVREATDLTVIPKLTGAVTDIRVFAKACQEAGADALTLINGMGPGMAIDIKTRKSRLGKNLTAGVGGPWVKPLAIRMVYQTSQVVNLPIIGAGGVTCAEDALEYMIAGASAVQIGRFSIIDPQTTISTINGMRDYLAENGIKTVKSLIGTFQRPET